MDELHTAKGYQSDFDLLIIVDQKPLTDRVLYWAKADERLIRELSITKPCTPRSTSLSIPCRRSTTASPMAAISSWTSLATA